MQHSSVRLAARLSLAFATIGATLYCLPFVARLLPVSLPARNAAVVHALLGIAVFLVLLVSVVCGFIALSGTKTHGRDGILVPAAIGTTLSALMLAPILYGIGFGVSSALTRVSAREKQSTASVPVQNPPLKQRGRTRPSALVQSKNFIAASNRTDIVHDPVRNVLYISAGQEVLRYSFASNQFLRPFELGGKLCGLDLSPDAQLLAVADRSRTGDHVWVHLIDLAAETNSRALFKASFMEGGTYSVAFGSDNALYTTSTFQGSGRVPFRRYDLASGAVSTIQEIGQNSMLSATPDRRLIAFAEASSSRGAFGVYDTEQKRTALTGQTDAFNWEVAINRDGTLVAVPTYQATLIAGATRHSVGGSDGAPLAAAFHPSRDVAFFPWLRTKEIHAYDTRTWKLVERIDLNEPFEQTGNAAFVSGRLRTSQDGAWLFVTVNGGVCYVRPKLSNEFADIHRR